MDMKLTPVSTPTATVNQIASKMEPVTTAAVRDIPSAAPSPNQINRTFEISKDPPVTILKYTNTTTKEVELQIPSEVSIQIYKQTQKFIADQAKRPNTLDEQG